MRRWATVAWGGKKSLVTAEVSKPWCKTNSMASLEYVKPSAATTGSSSCSCTECGHDLVRSWNMRVHQYHAQTLVSHASRTSMNFFVHEEHMCCLRTTSVHRPQLP
jgi:hypothetical protein